MSEARKWVRKQNDDILFFWLKRLIGMDASRYADDWLVVHLHMCSGFLAKMMEQTIVIS